MKTKYISFFLLCISALLSMAAPSRMGWKKYVLTNGVTINAMLVGDEYGHWYVDEKGNAMCMDSLGHLRYLVDNERNYIMNLRHERLRRNNARRQMRARSKQTGGNEKNNRYIGEHKGLVVLIEFPDVSFRVGTDYAAVRDFYNVNYNGKLRSESRLEGSVRDYFYDQSYGQFDLSFDIVGPYCLSKNHTYYGKNDMFGDDLHSCEMVIEALHKVEEENLDFSQYDWDGDGEIEQVLFIYAGTGENSSFRDDDVWPHEWDLESGKEEGDGDGAQNIGGYIVNTYSATSELSSGSRPDGIGTACHEFSHCLGLPDFYDVSYSGCPHMQKYDIMAQGCYNGYNDDSTLPVAFSSWERWMIGWLTPKVLSESCEVSQMPALTEKPIAYVIYNDAHPDEYLMLENRQPVGWDTYMTKKQVAHGLMIVHVDYDEKAWEDNIVNIDKNHPRYLFVPADNSYGTQGTFGSSYYQSDLQMAGDFFPGTKNVTSFTDTSRPAATLYNANTDGSYLLHKSLENISETDGFISFTFMQNPSGIENIEMNVSRHDVYSLQGIRMIKNIDSLPEGVYVVDGKKVIVRNR